MTDKRKKAAGRHQKLRQSPVSKQPQTSETTTVLSSIPYLRLIGVGVVMAAVAVLFSGGGILQFPGVHAAAEELLVDPQEESTGACEANGLDCSDSTPITLQTEKVELEGTMDVIADSVIDEKETVTAEDVKPVIDEKETVTAEDVKPDDVKTTQAEEVDTGACQKESCDDVPVAPSRDDYENRDITNDADYKIRDQLDEGDALLDKGDYNAALSMFKDILADYPYSVRALWGMAQAIDDMASALRSNKHLEEAIQTMNKAMREPSSPEELVYIVGTTLAERQFFRGMRKPALVTWKFLAKRFPDDFEVQHQLAVSLLVVGNYQGTIDHLISARKKWPESGLLKCLLGFAYRNSDLKDDIDAIPLLREGIESGDEGTADTRFFMNLGDAYLRTDQREKADEIYALGAEKGLFLSHYQRSAYNADSPLTGRAWWTQEQTTYKAHFTRLEESWKTIRDEGLALMDVDAAAFKEEDENLRETGDWRQFMLYQQGRKIEKNCEKCPKTCALFEKFTASSGCKRGQIKYSIMHPGVHVWPHVGPTNCRIRAHLGLVVPEGPRIRVVNDTRKWKEGEFIVFDDSFEHEVWHDGDSFRLVLIVDVWHPELSEEERQSLAPI